MNDFGIASRHAGFAVVRFVRRYAASAEELWAALTREDQLGRWLGAQVSIQPKVGGVILLRWPGGERMNGAILRCEPPRLLEYSWQENQDEPESTVTFEISSDGSGAVLVLEHRRLDPRSVVGFAAGWHGHLDALAALLCGGTYDLAGSYERLRPVYEARVDSSSLE